MCCGELAVWIARFAFGVIISAAIIHFSAWIVRLSYHGFGAAVACAITQYIAGALAIIPIVAISCLCMGWLGLIFYIIVTIWVFQAVYSCPWTQAFAMWLIVNIVTVVYVILVIAPALALFGVAGAGESVEGLEGMPSG